MRHFVEMRVPADAIPDAITVDLSNLDIAESLHISAVALPQGCRPLVAERNFTIATIVPPLTAAETPAPAAAVAAPAPAPAKAEAPKAKAKK